MQLIVKVLMVAPCSTAMDMIVKLVFQWSISVCEEREEVILSTLPDITRKAIFNLMASIVFIEFGYLFFCTNLYTDLTIHLIRCDRSATNSGLCT